MAALNRFSGAARSRAVAKAFLEALEVRPDGRVRVTFKGVTRTETVEYFLVAMGWNATYTGTQEAVIVRKPRDRHLCDMIPYARLISIEAVKS